MKSILSIFSALLMILSCSKSPDNGGNTIPSGNTVTIGSQIWMARNLDVSTYRNGDTIPQVTDPTQWANLTTGAWCYYINDSAFGPYYGKLYNWYAINDSRGLAPIGYHIPSGAEWGTLEGFLGTRAGGALKEVGIANWYSPNVGATNSSGFTALPGGYRIANGTFREIFNNGYWWTSTLYRVNPYDDPIYFRICSCDYALGYDIFDKTYGLSLRLVKD